MKKQFCILLSLALTISLFITGCGEAENKTAPLGDGVYTAEFTTDSSMFRVNDTYNGKGRLTVKNGEMTLHISLTSKNVTGLFLGLAEDAQKENAKILTPTVDTVVCDDGTTEEVHGFDVPVPAIGEEFDLALIGTKGKWYDHKVSVSNLVKDKDAASDDIADGEYSVEVALEGGSGKASVVSPALLTVTDGKARARIEWSSPNYDYMIADGETYMPINADGNSVFEIPVTAFDEPLTVIADTTAMGNPHEVEYTLIFSSDSVKAR